MFRKLSPNLSETISRTIVCAISATIILFVSIKFPGFDSMMALLGSFFSFTVSVIFPESCYLILYGREISKMRYAMEMTILLFGVFFALIGTVWVFLPQ
jgi:solute carrier family 32 (vesicular inhibitory amino acid transporter)